MFDWNVFEWNVFDWNAGITRFPAMRVGEACAVGGGGVRGTYPGGETVCCG